MRTRLKGLLSDAAVYGASSGLSRLIGFLLLPVYTRLLTPEDYGVLAMLTILSTLFTPVANLGMSNAIFRRFNLTKDEGQRVDVLSTALLSVVTASMLLAFGCYLAGRPLARLLLGSPAHLNLIQFSLITAVLSTVGAVPYAALRADRRVMTAALMNMTKLLISIGVTIWLVVIERKGVQGVVVGGLVGEIAVVVPLFATTLGWFRFRFIEDTFRAMLSYGLPFVPSHLQAAGIVYLGQYFIRAFLGLNEAGLYNVALKFAIPVSFVVNSIQKAWVPFKFQIHAEDGNAKEFFRRTATYYVAAVSYLWVGVSLWGPELLRLMTAASFHDASRLVAVASAVPLAQGLRYMLGTGMELSDDMRPLMFVTFAGLIALAISGMVLIPLIGPSGAALASTTAWLVMGYLTYGIARRRYHIQYDWQVIAALLSTSLVFVVLGQFVQISETTALRLLTASLLSILYPMFAFMLLCRIPSERARMELLFSRFVERLLMPRIIGWTPKSRDKRM